MGKVINLIKYDNIVTGEGHYNAIHDKYLYGVDYYDRTTEQLKIKITAENML